MTIARHFQEHEFLFLSQGAGASALKGEFEVRHIPNPASPVRSHRVKTGAATIHTLKVLRRERQQLRIIGDLIKGFKPDVALTDYEYFVPRACRPMGIPCLSLDHQHIVTSCRFPVPMGEMLSFLGASFTAQTLYGRASHFVVVSFFHPPLKPGARSILVSPILRQEVLACRPTVGDHVVAYQGYATFKDFLPFLKKIGRPVMVYGFDQDHKEENLLFRKFSEDRFLADLGACQYVVCGGGHTLISEALYLGKPVLSFPVQGMFEQFLNAYYVDKLGYGRCHRGLRPHPEIIPAFESGLDGFRSNIQRGSFCGNQEVFGLLGSFIKNKVPPPSITHQPATA
ncbi:MAG: hypothetical protein GY849_00615 [Deltaproteobacteria bacterium]|nr:hypothetical protein [Deltaproteobacteria bacterium]